MRTIEKQSESCLRIMKSAKQTEQKVAAVEATLLQRRQYLESVKDRVHVRKSALRALPKVIHLRTLQDALADTARRNELVAWH